MAARRGGNHSNVGSMGHLAAGFIVAALKADSG
jgi:hypothetical protein